MRSLGCTPCTGAIRSEADTVPKIIEEMIAIPPLGARKPRHRPRPGRLHGAQEARGLLLSELSALHHRRQRGRWQVHPHRPPALRLADGLRRPARRHPQSHQPAHGGLDLSLLTDGLRAEREQGITIDVAYRYFSTPRRKFIIADTPGHEQYTRNMATGASTADLAIVLIDARHGVLAQSRRHAFIATLLGIRHLVVAVNKMDLVEYREEVFRRHLRRFRAFAAPDRQSARPRNSSP